MSILPCADCAADLDRPHGCLDGYVDYFQFIGGVEVHPWPTDADFHTAMMAAVSDLPASFEVYIEVVAFLTDLEERLSRQPF